MLGPAGRPRVLHPDPPWLSPAWVLPTPSGGHFSGFFLHIAIFAREVLDSWAAGGV